MKIQNIHDRIIKAPRDEVGSIIDTLSSRDDKLWPKKLWPPMRLDHGLKVNSKGGHGPIRYFVEAYQPGRMVKFRFTGPKGFNGFHCFEVLTGEADKTVIKHTLAMDTSGSALITWPLIFRPLHDALMEDAFSAAQASLEIEREVKSWTPWVRFLRRILSRVRNKRVTDK
jgi:hypothetical protein